MRRMIIGVLLGILMLGGSRAWAEEATVTEEVKPLSGYDGGFFIRSPDGDFELKTKGRFQVMHRYETIPVNPDINTFQIRRGRVTFVATMFKYFEVGAFIQHSTRAAGAANTPYFFISATYRPMPQFGLDVGMITLPMDRLGEGSSGSMAFPEPSIIATQSDGVKTKTIERQSLGLPTTVGMRASGDVGRFHYFVGIGNGEGEHNFNATKALAYSARFAFDILGDPGYSEVDLAHSETPKFQIGLGAGFEPQDAIDAHINNVTLDWSLIGSADAAFKWRGLTLITEWYWRRLKVLTGNLKLDDVGYYGQAGYFVLPKKFEVVTRAAQIFREGPDNNAYEFGAGLNWYIHGNGVKLQTDFSRLLDFDDTEGQGHRAYNRVRTMLTINI